MEIVNSQLEFFSKVNNYSPTFVKIRSTATPLFQPKYQTCEIFIIGGKFSFILLKPQKAFLQFRRNAHHLFHNTITIYYLPFLQLQALFSSLKILK